MRNKLFLSAISLVLSGTLIAQAPADKKACNIVASVDNHTGTSDISKADLDKLTEIKVKNDCDKEVYTITSFEFTAIVDNKPIAFKGTGPVLTAEMKATLLKVKSGSKVFLDSFSATKADGTAKKIPGITLHVK